MLAIYSAEPISSFTEANQGLITVIGLLLTLIAVPFLVKLLSFLSRKPVLKYSLEYGRGAAVAGISSSTQVYLRIANIGDKTFEGFSVYPKGFRGLGTPFVDDYRQNGPFFVASVRESKPLLRLKANESKLVKIGDVLGATRTVVEDLVFDRGPLDNEELPLRADSFTFSAYARSRKNRHKMVVNTESDKLVGQSDFLLETIMAEAIMQWKAKEITHSNKTIEKEQISYTERIERLVKSEIEEHQDFAFRLSWELEMSRERLEAMIDVIVSKQSYMGEPINEDDLVLILARANDEDSSEYDYYVYRWLLFGENYLKNVLSADYLIHGWPNEYVRTKHQTNENIDQPKHQFTKFQRISFSIILVAGVIFL